MPTTGNSTPSRLATGDALPPELIHHIVAGLVHDGERHRPVPKRGLAACSLACRHWARSITPVLFRRLTLRSPEDVAQLKAFLDSPRCLGISLTDSLKDLIIECSGPCPWLHHLADLWKRMPDGLRHITRVDNASVGPRHLSLSGLMCGSLSLPRSLPARYYSPIQTLTLSNLVFPSKYKLFSFIDCLPKLARCRCSQITIRQSDHEAYRRPLLRRSQAFRWIQVTACGDGAMESQLSLGDAVLEPRKRVRLVEDIWKIAQRAATLLAPSSYRTVCISCVASESQQTLRIAFADVPSGDDEPVTLYDGRDLVRVDFEVATSPSADPGEIRDTIRSVRVTIQAESGEHASLKEASYAAFEDVLHELGDVPHLSISFASDTATPFRQLLGAVTERHVLGRLYTAGKLDIRHMRTGSSLEHLLRLPSEYTVDGETVVLGLADRYDYFQLFTEDQKERLLRAALARTRRGGDSGRSRGGEPLVHHPLFIVPVRMRSGQIVVSAPITMRMYPT